MLNKIWSGAFILCCLTQQIFSQNSHYGFMDSYYRDILYPGVSEQLVGTKVDFPGLLKSSGNVVSVGVLPSAYSDSWRNVYGWGEWNNGPGKIGLWLGGIDAQSQSGDFNPIENHNFSIQSALWITPFRHEIFRGISFNFDTRSEIWNTRHFSESREARNLFLNFRSTALIKLSSIYHLRTGIATRITSVEDERLFYNDLTGTQRQERNDRATTGTFLVGIVDQDGRRLDLSMDGRIDKSESSISANHLQGRANFNLLFTDGRRFQYRHSSLYYGLRTTFGYSTPSDVPNNTLSYAYMTLLRNMDHDRRTISGSLSAPLILDAKICRSLYTVLSLTPRMYAEHTSTTRTKNDHSFHLSMTTLSLGLRGTVGERLEYFVVPSISSNVFASVLEAKYRF